MKDLDYLRKKMNKELATLGIVRANCKTLSKSLEESKERLDHIIEAQELAQTVAQAVQQRAHDQIAEVVSRYLSAIFDEPYEFQIHFERKRGRTEARLTFNRDGMEVDPLSASGGGVVDVGSFALRQSCLILNKPPLRRIIFMDEPFKYVSEEYRERVRILLDTLAREMGVQFVMVTHINELKTGSVREID